MNTEQIILAAGEWLITAGIKLVISLLIIIFGFRIINKLGRRIERTTESKRLDKTISKTVAYAFRIGAKLLVLIGLIGYVGIDTSGVAALVASFGVGAGLALNGALSNLAGGVLIIITRPFKVDDYIEAQGYSGTVADIHVVCTKLITPDNKVVYLPNGALSSGNIVNYSEKEQRRVDISFTVAYGSDIDLIRRTALSLAAEDSRILLSPEPSLKVSENGKNGTELSLRLWVRSPDYWDVKFDMQESIRAAFEKEKIGFAPNRMEVRLRE